MHYLLVESLYPFGHCHRIALKCLEFRIVEELGGKQVEPVARNLIYIVLGAGDMEFLAYYTLAEEGERFIGR